MRAGTENVASIVGMATALKRMLTTMKDTASHLALLENRLLVGLSMQIYDSPEMGAMAHIPGNLSLSFPGYSGEALLHQIRFNGNVFPPALLATVKKTQISHVLQAIETGHRAGKVNHKIVNVRKKYS